MSKVHLRRWCPLCGKEPKVVNGSIVDEVRGRREELDCPATGIDVVNGLPNFCPAERLVGWRIDLEIGDAAKG